MRRWPTKSLGQLVSLEYGKALKEEDRSSCGQYPVYGSNGIVGTHNTAVVKEPTIVVGRKGAVGEVHFAKNGCWPIDTAYYTVLRQPEIVSLRYLLYWFRYIDLKSLAITVTIPGLNRNVLYAQEVPIPTGAEQDRIVKLLDESDELIRLRDEANCRFSEIIPALFHETFATIRSVRPLHELANVVSGVAKGRKFKTGQPETVPYLRVANVQDGYLDLTELKTIEALPGEVKELALRRGDVLLTEGGDFDKLGRGAMLEQDLPGCIHQNHVFRVRCDQSKLLPQYFASFLLSAKARLYFRQCAKKTSNLASINMGQLRALPVPAASLPEQKEFAQRITEIRQLKTAQTDSRLRLENLFQSLLHRAFNGQL